MSLTTTSSFTSDVWQCATMSMNHVKHETKPHHNISQKRMSQNRSKCLTMTQTMSFVSQNHLRKTPSQNHSQLHLQCLSMSQTISPMSHNHLQKHLTTPSQIRSKFVPKSLPNSFQNHSQIFRNATNHVLHITEPSSENISQHLPKITSDFTSNVCQCHKPPPMSRNHLQKHFTAPQNHLQKHFTAPSQNHFQLHLKCLSMS